MSLTTSFSGRSCSDERIPDLRFGSNPADLGDKLGFVRIMSLAPRQKVQPMTINFDPILAASIGFVIAVLVLVNLIAVVRKQKARRGAR